MKKNILFLPIIVIFLFINSCTMSVEPPYADEPWGCLINSDGTGFEWVMRGETQATFTQDSQKIVYKTSEGIFTRDFTGDIEQISSVSYHNYDYFSDDLQYLIDEDDNDIYRMDIDGSNRINLTETPDSRDYDSHISADGNWITYVSEVDTVYSIWIMDIGGDNKEEVISDSISSFFDPIFNVTDNKIYYKHHMSTVDRSLKSINIDGSVNEILSEEGYIVFKISSLGNIVAFTSSVDRILQIYFTDGGGIVTVDEDCYGIFDLDYFGEKLVWLRNYDSGINLFNLDYSENLEVEKGSYPTISPNGEKIFFIKDRELPIED